jgi:hypothetical protein
MTLSIVGFWRRESKCMWELWIVVRGLQFAVFDWTLRDSEPEFTISGWSTAMRELCATDKLLFGLMPPSPS